MQPIAVFGVCFLDIKGYASEKYVDTGTNVGNVVFECGGVCRNVAVDLANIGCPVNFVTVTDPDGNGEKFRRDLLESSVCLDYAAQAKNGMGLWLAIMNEQRDLVGSISRQPDFSPMETIIDTQGQRIVENCDSIILEVGMSAAVTEKICRLAEKNGRDVYIIMGNMNQLGGHRDVLRFVRMLVMNEVEAGLLLDEKLDPSDPLSVLQTVRGKIEPLGIREMIVTLGKNGSVYCDRSGEGFHVPAKRLDTIVDSTGAGDAFLSGCVYAQRTGLPIRECIRLGSSLAARTLQTRKNNCPKLDDFFSIV